MDDSCRKAASGPERLSTMNCGEFRCGLTSERGVCANTSGPQS